MSTKAKRVAGGAEACALIPGISVGASAPFVWSGPILDSEAATELAVGF